MLNFLIQKNRRKVKLEYLLRVFSIILLMMMLLLIHSICLLYPSYLLSIEKNITISSQSKEVFSQSEGKTDLTAMVKELNAIIVAMRPYEETVSPSEIIKDVIQYDVKDLAINGFLFERGNVDAVKIIVKGNAKTRDTLSSFIKAIRGGNMFENVELPISGFAKGTDIDFSLNLNLKK